MTSSSRKTAKSANRAAVKDWRARALRMHIDCFTMREIAAKVGKSLSTVHEGIEAELKAITAPLAEEVKARRDQQREIEGARLETVIRGAIGAARRGDAEAAHVVIAASRQRGKLYGLEAPNRTELSGPSAGPIHFDLSALNDDQIARLTAGDVSVLGGSADPPGSPEPGEGGAGTPPAGERVEG